VTTCTPIYMLPYQIGTDAPCDASDVWCDFTNALVALMDGFEDALDRTARTIPIAKVSSSVSYVWGLSGFVYDTEQVDTDSMVDLTISSNATIARNGKFAVVGYMEETGGVGANVFGLSTRRNFFTIAGQTDRHGGSALGAHPMDIVTIEPRTAVDPTAPNWVAGDVADTYPNFVSSQVGTISRSELTVYWFGDPS